jgi:hypothetical protein
VKRRWVAGALISIVVGVILQPAPAMASGSCLDFIILGARGSGEIFEPGSDGMGRGVSDFAVEMQSLLTEQDATVGLIGIDYPAIDPRTGREVFVDSTSKSSVWQTYPGSVNQGGHKIAAHLRLISGDTECPETKAILAGYSQGADAIGRAIEFIEDDANSTSVLERVAGIALFGDPVFNPRDTEAATGSYDPSRAGFFGVRDKWGDHIDAPVVSVCREGDFFCQFKKYRSLRLGKSGARKEALVNDVGGIVKWAEDHHGYNGPLDGAKLFREHEAYQTQNDTVEAALELADRMDIGDLTTAKAAFGNSEPVDVAIMIDSTAGAAGAVAELQSRASEFVHFVTDNVRNSRVAVVDYKGAHAGYDNPYQVNVGSNFSWDPQDAIDAINAIEPGGGRYGVIYSAVNTVDALPWREGVRKVTLTLSASRACAYQYCYEEEGTDVSYPSPRAIDAINAGVYTLNNEWFFETAGWSAAFNDYWGSRPGNWASSEYVVDELKRVFEDAVTADFENPLAGTEKAIIGQSGYYNADALKPFLANALLRNIQWSAERVSDLPEEGDVPPGDTVSRETDPTDPDPTDPDPGEPEWPADMGPTYQVEFEESGIYEVQLSALIDGEVESWSTDVWVDEIPTETPASPLLSSSVEGDEQILAWVAGEGEEAVAYEILDGNGEVFDLVVPVADVGTNGVVDFEYAVSLADGEKPAYTVAAVNAAGPTPATAVGLATVATYQHSTEIDGVISGRTLHFEGTSTPELDLIQEELDETETDATVAGDYQAIYASPSGEKFSVDMSAATTDLVLGDEWSIDIDLADTVDTAGTPIWERMRDGFADELLAGGYVDLQMNGHAVRVRVAPTAEVSQINEYVINPDADPPTGALVTYFEADHANERLLLEFVGETDPSQLPVLGEVTDPETDWSSLPISDVRTWIGDAEVSNVVDLTVNGASAGNETTPGDISVGLGGAIAGGSTEAMGAFLQTGTISFRVGDGQPNILKVAQSLNEAEEAYPPALISPTFVGNTAAKFQQYQSSAIWTPVVKWGPSGPGDLYVDGELPEGLWYDWDTHVIGGTPVEQGTFPVTVTATNDGGQTSRDYTIVVGPMSPGPDFRMNKSRVERLDSSTVVVDLRGTGYFRTDNSTMTTLLPVITQMEGQGGYLSGQLDDVVITDAGGVPVLMTGSFFIEIYEGCCGGTDRLAIYSEDANFGDNSVENLSTIFADGASISFRYENGDPNTVELAAAKVSGG